MRRGISVVLGILAMPASAHADSVSISAPAEGVVGSKSTISVTFDSTAEKRDLNVVRKPVGDAPCGASYLQDGEASESERFVGAEFQVGPGTHTFTYEIEWNEKPSEQRLCAWISGPGYGENPVAAPEARMNVRAPEASIAFTGGTHSGFAVDAGVITTLYRPVVEGTREMPSSVTGIWKRKGGCPPDADAGIDNRTIRFGPYPQPKDPGPFKFRGVTNGPEMVVGRPWVLCAYVFAPYVDEPLAVARTVVEPKTKPLMEGRPGVYGDGLPERRLTCAKGAWAAHPRKMSFSYRWFRNGRRVRARGESIPVRGRGRYACEVTARNALGKTTRRSRAYEVR